MPKARKKTTKKEAPVKGSEPAKRDIQIVNIVVSTSLEHDRIREPKTSALIFSSGKVVCTGARTLEKVEESLQQIIKSLEKINIKIKIKPKINVQNIVASGSVGMDLNLNVLAMKLENTEYEPEQFPGLVYKLPQAKATFLLFSNGKIVCTGTKSEEQVNDAVDKLIENLKKTKAK
jgi:transcription initiation factor TFIID TATA-box-binding protein